MYIYLATLEVVVVRVLCHSPIDEGPCEVVHSVLLVLDSLGHHLSIEVIMEEVIQMRLVCGGEIKDKEANMSNDHSCVLL